jgi:hypothetical protein
MRADAEHTLHRNKRFTKHVFRKTADKSRTGFERVRRDNRHQRLILLMYGHL